VRLPTRSGGTGGTRRDQRRIRSNLYAAIDFKYGETCRRLLRIYQDIACADPIH
jgi:hypothetical protein